MLCGSVDAMYDFFGCFRESVVLLWREEHITQLFGLIK